MVVDPVETRVCEYEVDWLGGFPGADVANLEVEPLGHRPPLGVRDHFLGRVNADNLRGRPALDQGGGEPAGSTAEVDHDVRIEVGDGRYQMVEGQGAFGREAQVLIGVPCHALDYGRARVVKIMSAGIGYPFENVRG